MPIEIHATVPKITNNIKAFWNKEDPNSNWPGFLEPSGAQYSRLPFTHMEDRGIENRLLSSLISALPEGTIIAGGFMTAVMGNNKDAQDIDLFFTSADAFADTFNRLIEAGDENTFQKNFSKEEQWAIAGYKLDNGSRASLVQQKAEFGMSGLALPGGWTVSHDTRYVKFVHPTRPPIQLIKLAWYKDAEHVIDSFDLTVAQFALDVATGDLVCNPISIMDLVGKKIVLHRMQFPSSTMRRVIKYTKKGYYACPGALTKIAEQVAEHIEDDDAQFVYVD